MYQYENESIKTKWCQQRIVISSCNIFKAMYWLVLSTAHYTTKYKVNLINK